MTGWEKLPTNIAPTELNSTYDIYATWLSRTNVDYHTVLSSNDYSVEEKLFILKQMASARSSINLGDKYAVKLGYNGLKPAIDLVATPTRYSGAATQTNYAPFSDGKSFTIAIDYKFEHKTSNTANEAILLSCYEDNNGSVQGFKLFYNPRTDNSNPVPQISFGSTA